MNSTKLYSLHMKAKNSGLEQQEIKVTSRNVLGMVVNVILMGSRPFWYISQSRSVHVQWSLVEFMGYFRKYIDYINHIVIILIVLFIHIYVNCIDYTDYIT